MDRSDYLRGGLVIAGMVVIPGMINFVLEQLGYSTLGTVIYYAGYATGVILVWYVWIRPLDLSGPAHGDRPDEVEPAETER